MPVDYGGCGQYRVRQPLRLLKEHTVHDTHVIDAHKDDMDDVAQALAIADIAIVRQGGEQGMAQIKAKFPHLKVVMDIDDNVEYISPYSEHYKEYGTQEFYDGNLERWIWKTGENGFNPVKNMQRVLSLLNGMKSADMVSVTTEKLAGYARKYNNNVVVLPNAVEVEKWYKLDTKPNKPLRVGWAGGISHYEDWFSIKRSLNKLMEKYDFTLVNIGSAFKGVVDKKFQDRLEVHPWVPFDAHSWHMACMDLDIAVIPLADLPFNNFKSSIKFYEMAALGVPSVVSNILPYRKDVKHEENALGYLTEQEFEQQLERLLTDARLRRKIGTNAYNWVRAKHNAKTQTKIWARAYENLTRKKGGGTLK